MELILENIRSFVGRHTIPLAPLTFLTGENSSGKSTLMAILSAVSNPKTFPFTTRFNEEPFELGSFDTIATYKGGKFGRAKYFRIGYRNPSKEGNVPNEVIATFISKGGQPTLSEVTISSSVGKAELMFSDQDKKQLIVDIEFPGGNGKEIQKFRFETTLVEPDFPNLIQFILLDIFQRQGKDKPRIPVETAIKLFQDIKSRAAISIAPIRTKPRRTYDQVSDTFNPEGSHIPFVLAKHLQEAGKQRDYFAKALEKFGNGSGLFKTIDVKQLGEKLADPFQIMITISGRPSNLLDVGYGVSQALPIVVESVLLSKDKLLLLQQPEVHLHPKAQAALGSFFVDLVRDQNKSFVIETHSDFIIDRIRQEVAAGKLDKDLFSILFLNKEHFDTQISDLKVDKMGNILDPPPNYRDFFLREELNLINRTEAK